MDQIAIGNFLTKKRKEKNMTQTLEHQRTSLSGLILIIMGMALLFLHYNVGGSNVKDFFSFYWGFPLLKC